MTLADAADAVSELLRSNGLTVDTQTTDEVIEYSWDRVAGVWLLLSQANGKPVLEVIDQRGTARPWRVVPLPTH